MEKSNLKKISPLSHSKVSSFSNCERKFSFNYLESISEPSSIHAAVGTFVHSVIENYYKNPDNKNPYFNWEKTFNYLQDSYEELWVKQEKYLTSLYVNQMSKVNNEFENLEEWINELIKNYIELEDWIQNKSNFEFLKFSKDLSTIGELKIENELFLKKEFTSSQDTFVLRGYVDRLQKTYNDKHIIIDIKTGKPPSKLDKEKSDQIKSYALLYGEDNIESGFIYFLGNKNINPEKRIFEVPIRDIDKNEKYYVNSYEKMSKKTVSDINNFTNKKLVDVWQPKINHLCNWCWYKHSCSIWIDQYTKIDTSILESKLTKLRHLGGLSKVDDNIQKSVKNIFYKINDLDLAFQKNFEDLKSKDLKNLHRILKSIQSQKIENSEVLKASNKTKKLLQELANLDDLKKNDDILNTFLVPNQKTLVKLSSEISETDHWKIISDILNNLQDDTFTSLLLDYENDFKLQIDDIRRHWIIWNDFNEVDNFNESDYIADLEKLIEFKLFRKDKLSYLGEKSLMEFLTLSLDKLKTLETMNYDDLTNSNNNFKPHFEDMISLCSKVILQIKELMDTYSIIESNLEKLSNVDYS